MMKRNVLALLVPTLLVAGAANAAEIYSKDGNKFDIHADVLGGYSITDDQTSPTTDLLMGYGFKGETQINDTLTGYAKWANDAEQIVGLKLAEYGTLDYGSNFGTAYDVLAWTHVLPAGGFGEDFSTDGMVGRIDKVTTYRNTDFFGLVDGLDFAAQFGAEHVIKDVTKDVAKDVAKDVTKTNRYGVSTSYTSPIGIGIAGAYSYEEPELASDNTRGEFWGTALKYEANNVYLAAAYAEGHNTTSLTTGSDTQYKTQKTELVAQYQFDSGLRPSIGYVQTRSKVDDKPDTAFTDLVKYFEVGATYAFNENMSAYADYKVNKKDSSNNSSPNVVKMGLVYHF
jgi:outer membrane pore protein F